MGLDTSHDCWHGPYGSFKEFRELVGRAAGLPYRRAADGDGYVLDIDWDPVSMRQIEGHWDRKGPTVQSSGIYDPPITDPVLYLLVHSDCDGKLRRGYLPALKKRLEELLPAYERLAEDRYSKHKLQTFIDGLQRAIDQGEHVDFH